ncbi:MAG: hypothetical protein HY713_00005, partial [candidate division NC10 bacterium]|nr:hypothetical protein [candidate division NC10 bacterium]
GGAGPCTLSLPGTSGGLIATFSQSGWPLAVNVIGPGTVTSAPEGINCSSGTCVATFPPGTTVSLSATPGAAAVFDGWSGACAGTGGCSVTLTTGQTVSAMFTARPTVTAFTANVAFPVQVGTRITWTTTVSGGVQPVEYEFTREDDRTPVLVQRYSTTSTYAWIPTATDIGSHRLQVAVRNAGSGSPGDDYAITESFEVIP